MELLGFSAAQVLTTLSIVGGSVVVLYLLKLRRRQVTVPFVKLWEDVLAEKQTTRLFSRLKRLLSLLLALAIVALLAVALGDPRHAGATAAGRTLVVLVDASASMKATDVAPSRLGLAQEEARRIVAGLGPADRMLIAQMDASTRPLSPMTDDPRILDASIENLLATDVAADFGAGLSFSLDVLREQPGAEIVVLSDGGLEPPSAELSQRLAGADVRPSFISVGTGSRNVAITAFSVRRYPLDKSQSEVLVELWNTSESDAPIELTLLGDGETIDVQRLTVEKGERLRRFFRNISGADRTLEARLTFADGSTDSLLADDRAFARLPARRRARVLVVSSGNLYLSAALLLGEYLDVTEVAPEDYPAAGRFDAVIFDGIVPAAPPDTDVIYLHPTPGEGGTAGPFSVDGEFERPFFDRLERRHPLLRWTALSDVNVARAMSVTLEDGDRAIAADERGPLIVAGTRNGRRMVALTFDVRESDLPLRVAWPLFLLNAIDWFVEEDAGYVSSYRTGETWHIPAPAAAQTVLIEGPDGRAREVPVDEGRAVFAGTEAGFYTLRSDEGEDVFAANIGPSDEARIEPQSTLSISETSFGEPSEGNLGVRRELWIYLVLGALVILLFEWLSYHRRWTV